MSGNSHQRPSADAGFTLFEIAIAITILGLSLSTIIGLQTSIIDAYSRERNRFHASLYGQYLMALVEADAEEQLTADSGPLDSKLTELGYFDDSLDRDTDQLKGWEYEQSVEPLSIPGREDDGDVMERVDMRIQWADSEDAAFSITFFRKINDKQKRDSVNP